MIAVDSSGIIAILFKEPEHQAFEDIITGNAVMPASASV